MDSSNKNQTIRIIKTIHKWEKTYVIHNTETQQIIMEMNVYYLLSRRSSSLKTNFISHKYLSRQIVNKVVQKSSGHKNGHFFLHYNAVCVCSLCNNREILRDILEWNAEVTKRCNFFRNSFKLAKQKNIKTQICRDTRN